jgi:hypothetical protein
MFEALILNRLFMLALGFSIMLKLVNKTLGIDLLESFRTKVMKGSRGLFQLSLMGFLLKLNMLEINWGGGMGKIEYLNVWELRASFL